MPAYNADLAKFAELDAQVVGISPDSPYSHDKWQKKEVGMLNYPLCSDFYPHAETAREYGILRESAPPLAGISERAIFVVDREGKIAWSKVYGLGELPKNEEVLSALGRMKSQAQHGD